MQDQNIFDEYDATSVLDMLTDHAARKPTSSTTSSHGKPTSSTTSSHGKPTSSISIVPQAPRKRGRPRGSKNKKTSNVPTVPKRKRMRGDREVFREFAVLPKCLMDPAITGQFNMAGEKQEICRKYIPFAEQKCQMVKRGELAFGIPVVVPSFQEPKSISYVLDATLPNLFLMNVLCSDNVCETRFGKVSVFPFTVYTSPEAKEDGVGGYPVLAVHVGHIKTLIWRIFSACRNADIKNPTLMKHAHYQAPYDFDQDVEFTKFTGFETYSSIESKAQGSYMLIPAPWFDVMKHYFITQHGNKRDIGEIFRRVYGTIPGLEGKFDDKFRAIWLGDERTANVIAMIRHEGKDHTFGMCRVRSLNNIVHVGKSGRLWILDNGNAPKHPTVTYNENSFAYGVQCWKEQIGWLNSAYTYFTGHILREPSHLLGLLTLDDTKLPVMSKAACVANGIHNDTELPKISQAVRRSRHNLESIYGTDLVQNFFGKDNTRVYLRKPQA